ncbi:MAG TPA: SDR family oxidoreductase [Nitrospira sp.]|jgi:dTDP-4-dehydrorhamnose reductase|nr:SDR family oxidoreductase [Nitrospira sp.]MCC7471997.1 SDR family oxidoreductase [Candidatus Nomurabacteria bacterium]HNL90910.1 SDR family oxidoreductase [Nitrospira sp.]
MKPVALITGAAGLIGGYLARSAPRWVPGWEVRGVTRAEVDLTDRAQVQRLWNHHRPNLVLHCAALSRTGLCEQDPAQARLINVEATRVLATLARDVPFVFLSTDQVFDGAKGCYVETDVLRPLNVYGKTKAEAEQVVLGNPAHAVVRIALTAGTSPTRDRSFVEDMMRAAAKGNKLTLFTDEFRCPMPAGALVRALWEFGVQRRSGVYHLGGQERLSRWEIGELLAVRFPELRSAIQPGSVVGYQGPPRPPDLSMCSDKMQALLSFRLPGLRQWLSDGSSVGADPWDYPHQESR